MFSFDDLIFTFYECVACCFRWAINGDNSHVYITPLVLATNVICNYHVKLITRFMPVLPTKYRLAIELTFSTSQVTLTPLVIPNSKPSLTSCVECDFIE